MLGAPFDIAVDTSGNVFIAEPGTYRIRKVAVTGIITTLVGNSTNVFSGDGGPATLAGLSSPTDILVDPQGDLILADDVQHRIRKVIYQKVRKGRGQLINDRIGGNALRSHPNPEAVPSP